MTSLATFDERSELFKEYLQLMGSGALPDAGVAPFGPDDALLVVDPQADFFMKDPILNPLGGKVGTPGSTEIVGPIIDLIDSAVLAGATVCATRNYHPHNHISFVSQGGHFPSYCVQGTPGSKFLPPIAEALASGVRRNGNEKVFVAFKAMHEGAASFAALPYWDGGKAGMPCGFDRGGFDRLAYSCDPKEAAALSPRGCNESPWTGCLVLKQSGLLQEGGEIDMDAPPDALALLRDSVDRKGRSLQDALKGKRRLFLCGLPLDFCVLDTALNARGAKTEGSFESVHVVLDATRAAHIHGIGSYGTGFLTDPAQVLEKLRGCGAGIVSSRAFSWATHRPSLSKHLARPSLARKPTTQRFTFPECTGPFALMTDRVTMRVQSNVEGNHRYLLELSGQLQMLSQFGLSGTGTLATPPARMPPDWPGAPPEACKLAWGFPVDGMSHLDLQDQMTLLSIGSSAALLFAAHGGFILFDRDEQVGVAWPSHERYHVASYTIVNVCGRYTSVTMWTLHDRYTRSSHDRYTFTCCAASSR